MKVHIPYLPSLISTVLEMQGGFEGTNSVQLMRQRSHLGPELSSRSVRVPFPCSTHVSPLHERGGRGRPGCSPRLHPAAPRPSAAEAPRRHGPLWRPLCTVTIPQVTCSVVHIVGVSSNGASGPGDPLFQTDKNHGL